MECVPISDLVPLSKYVLRENLDFAAHLHHRLVPQGEDIFNLECGILWPDGRNRRAVTCPIVEERKGDGLLLVDGLHRVWVARDIERREVTCAVIREVEIPLVPLPVTWEDVKIYEYGERPREEDKRCYRFPDAASLRAAVPMIAESVNDENFKYFLFRDLGELGSSGVRTPLSVGDSIAEKRMIEDKG